MRFVVFGSICVSLDTLLSGIILIPKWTRRNYCIMTRSSWNTKLLITRLQCVLTSHVFRLARPLSSHKSPPKWRKFSTGCYLQGLHPFHSQSMMGLRHQILRTNAPSIHFVSQCTIYRVESGLSIDRSACIDLGVDERPWRLPDADEVSFLLVHVVAFQVCMASRAGPH